MKSQCCGECAWWILEDGEEMGMCWFCLPDSVINWKKGMMPDEQGTTCPCFKRKAAKRRNKIVKIGGKSFADQVERAKRRYPEMWNKKGGEK